MSVSSSAVALPGPRYGSRWVVIPFDQITDDDAPLVGGKALSLATLARNGFPVPPGFAVTTEAYRRHLEASGVGVDLRRVESRLRAGLPLPSKAHLGELRARLVAAPLPPGVRESLILGYRNFFPRNASVAVRSSATREDLPGASFAGQYETYLNIRGAPELERAVKQCWASLWSPRVLEYLQQRSRGAGELAMAIAVQQMVDADVAGVLFSVNPVTGRENEAVVESAFGLGEALVGGRVNADAFVVDIHSGEILRREIARKMVKVVSGETGTRTVSLTEPDASRPSLTDRDVKTLGALAANLQDTYGRPIDAEWLFKDGQLYVVQARPITRLGFAADFGEWTTADFKDGGVSSDVCSPLMWSLYESAFEHSMPAALAEIKLLPKTHREVKWARMFFGRPYWNLGAVKSVLARVPGYQERNFDTDLGIQVNYSGDGKATPVTPLGIARALPVLFALQKSFRDRLISNRAFVQRFAEAKKPYDLERAELAALDEPMFAQRFRALITEFYFETETRYFSTIYNTSNSKMEFKVHFDRANRACGGDLSYLKLVGGLRNLSHMRPMVDLHELLLNLQRCRKPVDASVAAQFAARWKHHGRRELDIRVPRWKDDAAYVLGFLRDAQASFRSDQDPRLSEARQHAEYLAERTKAEGALRRRPWARRRFLQMLELVRAYAWWREEMRDHSSYVYFLVRLWSVEAALRLVERGAFEAVDDVWHLSFQDVLAAVEGTLSATQVQERVRSGRRGVRAFRNFKNPDEIGSRHTAESKTLAAPGGRVFSGIACSPGRVEGTARVVKDLDEAARVQPGDVLVTPFTDPGWTPLFARLGAVVTETGGLLSHAAVISREYGIPAILAVAGATRAIADGARVRVDGARGTVELL